MSEKIMLISPYMEDSSENIPIYNRIWPPLDLANCAALLEENGFIAEILDANAERLSNKDICKKAKEFNKIFITTSTIDRWQCPHLNLTPVLKLIKEMRKNKIAFHIIGTHGSVRPKEILKLTGTRSVLRGEPELTVLDICKRKGLSGIKGITYRKGNKIISNPDRPLLGMDELPMPAFHLLPIKKYFYEILGGNFMLFEGSRGCPFSCIYCLKKMYGFGYRKKSPEKLIQEVEHAISLGVKTAYFIDLEFNINRQLVEKLCDFLIGKQYDFKWTCQTRFDTIDLSMLKKMKKAGCKIIHFGIETGSPKIMQTIDKKITIDCIRNGMKLVKKSGIKSVCFFMFGIPGETKEDMEMTIKLAKELNPDYVSFHIATPYPGTKLYETVKNELGDDLFPSAYGNEDELKKMVNKAFISFYLRPSYLLSRLRQGEIKLLFKQVMLFFKYLKRKKK
ncbi:MAG: radical SAM protein [Candidatus Aenigmarchaeota archaeon]|nr:radical SAM protein [Candidatus Aenigmarchaeota archaeon]